MTQQPPTSVPVLGLVSNGSVKMGITSVDVHPSAWGVRGRVVGANPEIPKFRMEALDTSSLLFEVWGGGVGGGDGSYDFHWHFASSPPIGEPVRLIASADDLQFEVPITLDEPSWPGDASIRHMEPMSSSRWPGPGDRGWRAPESHLVLKEAVDKRSPRALPDEVVSLGVSVGEVAGHELVFLSAERWQDVWWLHHHWENPAAMHSPLRGDVLLTCGASTIIGTLLSGGTTPNGVVYTHGFVSRWLPDRLTVRLPAADHGPALIEAELTTT
jgi:hypothetical protein